MPTLNEMMPRDKSYLTKEDFPQPALVTVDRVTSETFEKDGKKDRKLCIFFKEYEKGMIAGWRAAQQAASIFNSEDTDDWIGKQAVIFNDLTVEFQGKKGGLSLRKTKQQLAAEAEDSNIPF